MSSSSRASPEDAAAVAAFLTTISPLNPAELAPLMQSMSVQSYPSGRLFTRVGEAAGDIAMVLRGLFRIYYVTEGGKQLIRRFAPEGRVLGDMSAMIAKGMAVVSTEAIEDSTIAVFPFATVQTLYDKFPAWERFGRRLVERYYLLLERREYQFLAFPAKERYRLFRSEYPGLEDRVSKADIASYLGITAVQLSRIRSSKK